MYNVAYRLLQYDLLIRIRQIAAPCSVVVVVVIIINNVLIKRLCHMI